jgi:gas vesicle protein
MNTTSKVALGVLAGLATGAIVGILFAPDKGSETRKKIAGRSRDLVNGVKESFNELKEAVTDQLESAGNLVSELSEQVTTKPELKKEGNNNLASNEKNHQNSMTNQNRR